MGNWNLQSHRAQKNYCARAYFQGVNPSGARIGDLATSGGEKHIDLNIEDDIDIEDDVDIDQKPGFSRPSCVRAILMVPGPAPDRDPATTLHSAL